jgi:mannose-1-phosphate guanylyltransferase
MKAPKFIHASNSQGLSGSASGLLAPWTMQQIQDEVVTLVLAEKNRRHRDAAGSAGQGPYLSPNARPATAAQTAPHRWGVVLAGGEGVRLRELTRWVCGEDRPKQFCSLLGDRTLLEDARLRAERSFPPERILFCLTRMHQNLYRRYLACRPSQRIVQPFNKGTAPAILCALKRIAQADRDAVVSVLPSDHYYSSESAFTAALESAMDIAEQRDDSVVLLGAQPTRAEVDYGWIELGESLGGYSGLFRVERFQEKPSLDKAQALLRSGSLWNTFVMVGHLRAFSRMAWATVPRLMDTLESMEMTAAPGAEVRIPESVFGQIPSTDFSRHVLAAARSRLLAFRLENSDWNDLGDPYRVLATLVERDGDLPPWARLWPDAGAAWAAA